MEETRQGTASGIPAADVNDEPQVDQSTTERGHAEASQSEDAGGSDASFVAARKTVDLLRSNAVNRPTLYRILELTDDMVALPQLEAVIQEMPEYATATQPPYCLVEWLVDAGALQRFDLDAEGAVIDDARREGLSEDELDELVADYAFQLTEPGRIAREHFDPRSQARDLFSGQPLRKDAYLETLSFVQQRRSLLEIDRHLRDASLLCLEDGETIQTSSVMGKLADIGAVTFDRGWLITADGARILEDDAL